MFFLPFQRSLTKSRALGAESKFSVFVTAPRMIFEGGRKNFSLKRTNTKSKSSIWEGDAASLPSPPNSCYGPDSRLIATNFSPIFSVVTTTFSSALWPKLLNAVGMEVALQNAFAGFFRKEIASCLDCHMTTMILSKSNLPLFFWKFQLSLLDSSTCCNILTHSLFSQHS